MKLAIMADLHIGYERFDEDAYRQAREALEHASGVADAVLIAGDIFDKRSPKPEVIAQAINIFRDMSRRKWPAKVGEFRSKYGASAYTDVPIIAIPGTHERVAEGKENVLQLLALAGLLVDASEATAVLEMGQERVAVTGMGGVSEERVVECIAGLNPVPTPGAFNVFMMHQSVFELLPFNDAFIRYEGLPKGFDLYVNGHIHGRVEAMVHGRDFIIPGSTVLTQLKDSEQEAKGFVLFDTKSYTHEFMAIKSRPFVSSKLEFKEAQPKEVARRAEEAIDRAIARAGENPIVRVVLSGTVERGTAGIDIPLNAVRAKYAGRAEVVLESELETPEIRQEIADLRENKIEGVSIKEIGMAAFSAKLKEHGFDGDGMPASRLFDVLSDTQNREKVLKEAMQLLDG